MAAAAPLTLIVATTNSGKLREIRELLSGVEVRLQGLADLPPVPEPEETGLTFEANARLKALYYDRRLGRRGALTVAEDSGLMIDALDGAPGIHSARFLGPGATYPARFAEIERRLQATPDRERRARFVCAVAVVAGGEVLFEIQGTIEGEIARTPAGAAGFGYDPIFFFPPYGRTLAEVTQEEKLREAHRGKAFRGLAAWLRTKNGER